MDVIRIALSLVRATNAGYEIYHDNFSGVSRQAQETGLCIGHIQRMIPGAEGKEPKAETVPTSVALAELLLMESGLICSTCSQKIRIINYQLHGS